MKNKLTPTKNETVVKNLIGSWQLISCEHWQSDGSVHHPFGPNPKGRLVYMGDGRMIVIITNPSRPKAISPQFFEATDPELAMAAKGCVAYFGQWKINEKQVLHDVDQSLFPNWSGTPLARFFKIESNLLTLTTGKFLVKGIEYTATLVWEKEK